MLLLFFLFSVIVKKKNHPRKPHALRPGCFHASFQYKRDLENFQAASPSHGRVFSRYLENSVPVKVRVWGGNASA